MQRRAVYFGEELHMCGTYQVWPFLCAINGIRDMLNICNLQFGLEAPSDMPYKHITNYLTWRCIFDDAYLFLTRNMRIFKGTQGGRL